MGREKSISLPTRHWQLCPEGQSSSGKAEDTAPCVWKWQLCLQADAAGGVEQSHNIPTREALTLQEQRAEPPSCSLHRDFGTRALSWGSAGFTKDGHGNAREHGCGRAAQIPRWAGVAMQQSSNEDTTPWAQVKPRIKELVHPRIRGEELLVSMKVFSKNITWPLLYGIFALSSLLLSLSE